MTLDDQAIYWHELYMSFVKAGFGMAEALTLTCTALQANVMAAALYPPS